jgi:hypothetical protein
MDVVALMVHGLVTVALAAARRLPLPRLASLLKVFYFCYPLHCLLRTCSSRRNAMAALNGTTTSDGEAGVVDKIR